MAGNQSVDQEELSTMLFSLLTPTSIVGQKPVSSEVTKKTKESVDKIVREAFQSCDADQDGRLQFLEFKNFLTANPDVMARMEEVLVRYSWESLINDFQDRKQKVQSSNIMGSGRVLSGDVIVTILCPNCKWQPQFCYSCGEKINTAGLLCNYCGLLLPKGRKLAHCMNCAHELERKEEKISPEPGVPHSVEPHEDEKDSELVIRSGPLYRKSSVMKQWKRRWYILTPNFLYCFKKQNDEQPERVTFIEGCYIEFQLTDDEPGYFGFEVIRGDENEEQTKLILYAQSVEDRQRWVADMRKSAKTVPITDIYDIGAQIGKGKFSLVHFAYEKSTGDKYAVKILDKKKIEESEKEALRQEIAILNVVRHPRVVQMREVFETPDKLYIVLKLYPHGDLFKFIRSQKSRLSETTVKKLIWNIVDAIVYLHTLGIVHRDLKPENILLEDPEDCTKIVLSDFGLSKFATPQEIMKTACGTLSYVAPEVLRLAGYTKAVDYWSVGVIMYLLLSGYLPFSGKSEQDTISQTLKSEVKFNQPSWKTVSSEARILVSQLLKNEPSMRPTGEKLLKNVWFDEIRQEMEEEFRKSMDLRHTKISKSRHSRTFDSSPEAKLSSRAIISGPPPQIVLSPDSSIGSPDEKENKTDNEVKQEGAKVP
eukprot:TRINITY_DN6486_c0_g1_i7.p1 TRINITY_DN6486_c0_g1~~TRINITY_DN6486_c0_g1_i7.p1  ORF type:complete len:765 (+),score=168.23 TRINITY_DN6486_c0_g1_i7:343-2295(+)